MKAVVLSGGEGTRVRPLTYDLPKPMVPVIEKPIMGYLFDLLKKHHFEEVVVTVSYKANMLKDHYQNGRSRGMYIAYSLEGRVKNGKVVPEALGSAGGLKRVQNFSNFFDEPFLVICGDAITDLDLSQAMAYHKSHNGVATVVCKEIPKKEVYRYGVVVTDASNKIESFQEKPKVSEAKSNCINTGIYIFNPEILSYIPENQPYDIGGDLLPSLVEKGVDFYAFVPKFHWIDVGTTADFYHANMKLMTNAIPTLSPYGREVRPGIWMGINCDIDLDAVELTPPIYIGNSVRMASGVKVIGPSVIESGCILKQDVVLDRSVLLRYTKIGESQHFSKSVLNRKYVIDSSGSYVHVDDEGHNLSICDSRE